MSHKKKKKKKIKKRQEFSQNLDFNINENIL